MGAPVFGAYMLRIDIYSSRIVLFINMKWPSLSLLIDFGVKFTLSDMNEYSYSCLYMGSICLENFFPPFDSKPGLLFFSVRWVSCKQHMVGSYFLTQFAILCLLIGVLRSITFSVNFDRCLLFPVSFVPLLFSFTYSLFICLLAQKALFFLESSCLTLVSSSICKSPLSIFCSTDLVVTNSFSFSLLWQISVSTLIRKDSFAG
jgi:hypothetical protein